MRIIALRKTPGVLGQASGCRRLVAILVSGSQAGPLAAVSGRAYHLCQCGPGWQIYCL